MESYRIEQTIKIIASTGKSLQLAQFVRMIHPSDAIDRIVMRLMGVREGDQLEDVYGGGRSLNGIASGSRESDNA